MPCMLCYVMGTESAQLLTHLCFAWPPVILYTNCACPPPVPSVALGQIVSGKHSKLSGMVSEQGPPFPTFRLGPC